MSCRMVMSVLRCVFVMQVRQLVAIMRGSSADSSRSTTPSTCSTPVKESSAASQLEFAGADVCELSSLADDGSNTDTPVNLHNHIVASDDVVC